MSGSGQAYGQMQPEDSNTDLSVTLFHVRAMLDRVRANIAVKVISCSNSGGLSAAGTVSVQPQVSMLDTAGNPTPHGIITNVPYFRLQGGTNAIICDPVAGDIGWCNVLDRDTSAFKSSLSISNPGSWRRFDLADSTYLGGMLNAAPTQYIQFSSAGITIADMNGNTIVMNSSGINLNGMLIPPSSTGNWQTHIHSGVTFGTSDTGPHV